MSKSLKLLTKNERMSELLVLLSESLIPLFFRKKQAIPSENRWANSQPCVIVYFVSKRNDCFFREVDQNLYYADLTDPAILITEDPEQSFTKFLF